MNLSMNEIKKNNVGAGWFLGLLLGGLLLFVGIHMKQAMQYDITVVPDSIRRNGAIGAVGGGVGGGLAAGGVTATIGGVGLTAMGTGVGILPGAIILGGVAIGAGIGALIGVSTGSSSSVIVNEIPKYSCWE